MSIGLGILLAVVGAVLLTKAVNLPDSWPIDTVPLGWILLIAGIVAIALSLVLNRQRQSTRTVERRYDEGPPPR